MSSRATTAVQKLKIERCAQLMTETARKKHGRADAAAVASCIRTDLQRVLKQADAWTEEALKAVISAPGGEAYTRESAAQKILDKIAERRSQ